MQRYCQTMSISSLSLGLSWFEVYSVIPCRMSTKSWSRCFTTLVEMSREKNAPITTSLSRIQKQTFIVRSFVVFFDLDIQFRSVLGILLVLEGIPCDIDYSLRQGKRGKRLFIGAMYYHSWFHTLTWRILFSFLFWFQEIFFIPIVWDQVEDFEHWEIYNIMMVESFSWGFCSFVGDCI
jgi:hypothetical protein